MNIETIENIATKIEEAGLKRHMIDDEMFSEFHHYVIEINYDAEDEDDIMNSLPAAFESVCENEHDGKCDGTFMFYLEDIEEDEAEYVIRWLEDNDFWTTADVPSYFK